jgi:hypothetical protein
MQTGRWNGMHEQKKENDIQHGGMNMGEKEQIEPLKRAKQAALNLTYLVFIC